MSVSATRSAYTFAVTSALTWKQPYATAIVTSHDSVEAQMPSPHDLIVKVRGDPCAPLMCPMCGEPFIGELGVAQLCTFQLAEDREWITDWLIFCGHLCAWMVRRKR